MDNYTRTRYVDVYIDVDRRKPQELANEISGLIDKVPEEYRDSARVTIDTRGYDDSSIEVALYYQSPMTAEELLTEKKRLEYSEAAARRQYEELKKRFG